ncbi:MAG: protease modulator HflC, partial [Rhodospirillales bacterium]
GRQKVMRGKLALLGVLAIVIAVLAYSSLFTVHQAAQALVLQFGNPIRVEREPGLKVKLPFIQNVEFYDKRILDLDPIAQEVTLQDQKRINVDAFVRFRIIDPLEFRKKAQTLSNFRSFFGGRLNSAVREGVGKVLLGDMLTAKRAELMGRITAQMKTEAEEFGVEVVDVRIGRTDLPEATSQAVYNRMRSDRVAQAAQTRAQGEEQRLRIQADADRQKVFILAEANKQGKILLGEGEAAKTKLLADAFGRDPEFFAFYRALEAYGEALPGSTMVLSPDSEFFRYFQALPGGN